MTTFQQYGIVPCAYDVPCDRPNVRIERRYATMQGFEAWAIVDGGCCLNRDNEWEYEPQPSSRTDEFKARTRYPLQEAMQKAVDYFKLGMVE